MSLIIQASPLIEKIKIWKQTSFLGEFRFTTTQKVILWSIGVVGTSALVVGVLSSYLARKRVNPIINPRIRKALNKRLSRMRSPNGAIPSGASSLGGRSSPAQFSERLSLASGSLGSAAGEVSELSPQQLGVMGMEALETTINYWEDALAAFSMGSRNGATLAVASADEAQFCKEIQDLLQNAYLLQERSEMLFLDQRSVLFRSESGAGHGAGGGGDADSATARTRLLSVRSHSSQRTQRGELHSSAESFASAEDQHVADLRDLEDFNEIIQDVEKFELYQSAMKQLEYGIPCRTLRTEVVMCNTDSEFLCKLHCIRLALQVIFLDVSVRAWLVDSGRQILTDLLLFADKEPKEFLVAYEDMLTWVGEPHNWPMIEKELTSKGVKAMTFYDVVLDYILLDAFEDLNCPPTSVLAIVNNRWLSNGFKESALTTTVWSVIKAKRSYLQHTNGFMSHFYAISEHLLPVLVWGFLGPDANLKEICQHFRDEIIGFVVDMFSFQKSRYVTVDELASDVLLHLRIRVKNIMQKMANKSCY